MKLASKDFTDFHVNSYLFKGGHEPPFRVPITAVVGEVIVVETCGNYLRHGASRKLHQLHPVERTLTFFNDFVIINSDKLGH